MQMEFADYTHYVRSMTENLHYEPKDSNGKNVKVLLEGLGGLPLIAPATTGVKGDETAEIAGIIIWQYFIRHYRKSLTYTPGQINMFSGLATGTTAAHPPWEKFKRHPEQFFRPEFLPPNFILQDPSRMGKLVKVLIDYIWKWQETLGVNAFHFHHIFQNNKMEEAYYGDEAKIIIAGNGMPLVKVEMEAEILVEDIPQKAEVEMDMVGKEIGDGNAIPLYVPTMKVEISLRDPLYLPIMKAEISPWDPRVSLVNADVPAFQHSSDHFGSLISGGILMLDSMGPALGSNDNHSDLNLSGSL